MNAEPVVFAKPNDWLKWLKKNHAASEGIWLRLAKKGSAIQSITYAEALEAALCYGWIDAQKKPESTEAWLQRFTPRRPRSIWSKRNRNIALSLIAAERMQPAGLAQIERAKKDGRWEAAYDSPATATVPEDFAAALAQNPRAKAFFATLDSANRYAVLFRIQTVKRTETRERRIRQFVEMLSRHEKIHP
ncbi:MAG: YdeI/OmpD-associated family protein [Bryobacteraceae bacterium]|jgi:uncharacterized protein YdeI (YjbR/CyaY-like superfamily)